MAFDVHAFLRQRFVDAGNNYLADLEALTPDQLNTSPGGVARTAYDYTYEVAYVNRRIATRMRGETPEPFPQGWMIAPDEFRHRTTAVDAVKDSVDQVLQAWDAIPISEIDREIPLANGAKTDPADLMFLAANHTSYHDAQLNFLQSLLGDGKMHWTD